MPPELDSKLRLPRLALPAMRRFKVSQLLARLPWPEALGGLGIMVHGLFVWGHTHGQVSVMDEGLYLTKGWLFAMGRYRPFQDFGPLTNHMPLSFLIPGWVQVAFGPGLRTGRLMALSLGLLMMIGLWIVGRRLAGRWWALIPIWGVALNPFLSKIYAQAISQVLVAAMLVWILVLVLGPHRPKWQLLLGSALAGTLAMTRINMLPVLPVVVGYIAWEYGRRAGVYAVASGLAVLAIGHAVYWPGILKLWAAWIPGEVSPFLDVYRQPAEAVLAWDPQVGIFGRWDSFVTGLLRHLLAFVSFTLAALVWIADRESWRKRGFRLAAALGLLFFGLTLLHAWASLGKNYCVFCFQMYLGFFHPVALLLLALTAAYLLPRMSPSRRIGVLLLGVLLLVLAGPRDFRQAAVLLLSTQVSRAQQLRFFPGTLDLSVHVESKMGLPYSTQVLLLEAVLALWALALLGVLGYVAFRVIRQRGAGQLAAWASPALMGLFGFWMVVGMMVNGNRFGYYDCGSDVIAAHEAAGRRLRQALPPGASIFWAGGLSAAPLLYAPDVEIFPPQLNMIYSYRLAGDAQGLLKLGLWSPDLEREWLGQADYLLVAEGFFTEPVQGALHLGRFDELESTPPTDPCRQETSIHIYRRLR